MRLNILIRLPNWLGDMVMATPMLQTLRSLYPGATVDVVVKKGLDFLVPYLPAIDQHVVFSKASYKGLPGAWRFGKSIAAGKKYDLFICLPDSFSSAVMARATGAKTIIGYKKEGRSWLLSHAYPRPANLHRAEVYQQLLQRYAGINMVTPPALLQHPATVAREKIIVNINSEATSRRLPIPKAIQCIAALRSATPYEIVLIGSPAEQPFVTGVYDALPNNSGITNAAGQTTLPQLISLLASAKIMLTTDSGPAHVANALGTHTVVLFGAGNEHSTAPFNTNKTIIRLGQLPCEPCVSNTCKPFGSPRCLELLDEHLVIQAVIKNLSAGT